MEPGNVRRFPVVAANWHACCAGKFGLGNVKAEQGLQQKKSCAFGTAQRVSAMEIVLI